MRRKDGTIFPAEVIATLMPDGNLLGMLIRTQQTPNPATRKFLPDQVVMEAGTRDFADAQSAEASPLAGALFMDQSR